MYIVNNQSITIVNFYPLPTSLHLSVVVSFVALMAHFTTILTICLHYGDKVGRVLTNKIFQ